MIQSNVQLTKKDLVSDQEVRWCPGCGDYAILSAAQTALAKLGIPKEKFVVVSGIGCSSRFPYYMDTYGFHSIHGRAPAIASGIKTANPDLSVWLVTGDGDGLSIGGNHMIHILRRNLDVKILLFNNEIYGLTKGQYSPTSPIGQRTKSTPMGSVDRPFDPLFLAVGSGATFVARTMDKDVKHMGDVLQMAAEHKGTCFVEILQNCVIFNDGAFDDVVEKKVRAEKTIDLRPGQPMVYGAEKDKGLRFGEFRLERCSADEASVWDPTEESVAKAMLVAELDKDPEMPAPIGMIRKVDAPLFEQSVHEQLDLAVSKQGEGALEDLIYSADSWVVD